MNCPKCGSNISERETFCSVCGEKTENTVCPVCETLNLPGAETCAVCGEVLPKPQPKIAGRQNRSENIFCRNCGTANPQSNQYCSVCGRPLKDSSHRFTPPTPAPSPAPTPSGSGASLPLIIGLSIAAVLCVIIALVVVISDKNESSDTPDPTQVVATPEVTNVPIPTVRPTPVATPRPTPIDIVEHDSGVTYSTYSDSDYSFSCPYPSEFYKTSNVSDFTRYCLKANDSSGIIYICGTNNDANLSVATVADNFKSSHQYNDVLYDERGSNYCSVLITNGYNYNYCYYNLSGGKIRGFEMQFDVDKYPSYIDYISYMQNNLSLY